MSWNEVKLAEVSPSNFPEIGEGTYTFSLLPGATVRTNRFGTEELVVSAAITDGPNAGRRIFLQYPDPESVNSTTGKKQTWSAQALKKLEVALGIEQTDSETAAEWLNRVANTGAGKFTLSMEPANKIKEGETTPRIEPKLFKVGAAA